MKTRLISLGGIAALLLQILACGSDKGAGPPHDTSTGAAAVPGFATGGLDSTGESPVVAATGGTAGPVGEGTGGAPQLGTAGTAEVASGGSADVASSGTPDVAGAGTPHLATGGTPDAASAGTPDAGSGGSAEASTGGSADDASGGTPDLASGGSAEVSTGGSADDATSGPAAGAATESDSETHSDSDTDSNADTGADAGLFTVDYQLASDIDSDAPGTVGIVTWSIDVDSLTEAHIEFGLDAEYGTTAPVDLNEADFRTLLLGMKPDSAYHFRVVASDGAITYTSDDYVVNTGPPTSLLSCFLTRICG